MIRAKFYRTTQSNAHISKKMFTTKNQAQFSVIANDFAVNDVGNSNQTTYSFKDSFQLIAKRFPTVLIYSVNGE
jgi:hypothetical protein